MEEGDDSTSLLPPPSPKMEFGEEINTIYINDFDLESLLRWHCYKEGLYDRVEDHGHIYYRDLANLGIRIHDLMKVQNHCSCAMIERLPGTVPPVCCVLVPALQDFTRQSSLVIPEESLFYTPEDSEDEKKKGKRARRPKRRLEDRNLCMVMMVQNDSYGRVEIHHSRVVYKISGLMAENRFHYDVNNTIAQEIWTLGIKQSYGMQWKPNDPTGAHLKEMASYRARRSAHPVWIGIKAIHAWPEASVCLGYSADQDYTSGYSISDCPTLRATGTAKDGEARRNHGVDDESKKNERRRKRLTKQTYAPDKYDYNIIRDYVVQTSMGYPNLIDLVDCTQTLTEREREDGGILVPSEASRISVGSFQERRQDDAKSLSRYSMYQSDRPFIHDVEIFYKVDTARKHAYRYRLPLFAHDKTASHGSKYFSAMGSWTSAYYAIRQQSYVDPIPGMHKKRKSKKTDTSYDEPSYHQVMRHSHECFGGPRRVKLFIDMDAKVMDNPGFKDPKTRRLSLLRVDHATRTLIRWFTNFVNGIFGDGTCTASEDDWVVTCASHVNRGIISRHICLAKPGCYFNTALDLKMFVCLAKIAQIKAIHARDPKMDHRLDSKDPISWMIRNVKHTDSLTQTESYQAAPIVDFGVYHVHGNLRCTFSSKLSDPARTLKPVTNLFKKREDGSFAPSSCYQAGRGGSIPVPTSKEDIVAEYETFLRTLVTYVERTEEQKRAGFQGWKMPVGAMMSVKEAEVPHDIVALNEGIPKEEARLRYFLAGLPTEAWYSTSSVAPGVPTERVKRMVNDYVRRCGTISDFYVKGSTRFVSVSQRRSTSDDDDPVFRIIREYFARQDIALSGHHLAPLLEGDQDWRYEKKINPNAGKDTTLSNPSQKRRRRMVSKWKGSSTKEIPKLTAENKKDHYQVYLDGSNWCPIREFRVGSAEEGYHGTKSIGHIRFLRDGRVKYSCKKDKCKTLIKQTYHENAYYWLLPPMTLEEQMVLWGEHLDDSLSKGKEDVFTHSWWS